METRTGQPAKFAGRCALCGLPFEVGAAIWRSALGWAHAGCPPADPAEWLRAYWRRELSRSPVVRIVREHGEGVEGLEARISLQTPVDILYRMALISLPRPLSRGEYEGQQQTLAKTKEVLARLARETLR